MSDASMSMSVSPEPSGPTIASQGTQREDMKTEGGRMGRIKIEPSSDDSQINHVPAFQGRAVEDHSAEAGPRSRLSPPFPFIAPRASPARGSPAGATSTEDERPQLQPLQIISAGSQFIHEERVMQPKQPIDWSTEDHFRPLLDIYDNVVVWYTDPENTRHLAQQPTMNDMVVGVVHRLLQTFPELGQGEVQVAFHVCIGCLGCRNRT